VPKILDALALASMEGPAQIQRLAALWCRAHQNRTPYNSVEIGKWVKREFGPLLGADKAERIAKKLLIEAKRQARVRSLRARRGVVDPFTTSAGSNVRMAALLHSRLGPARRWANKRQIAGGESSCHYIDFGLYSGLIAGLIPLTMRLRRISNPNLLVYRYRQEEPRTRFVATHITTVADAFIWLIPPEAAEFLQLPGTRVEHDGESQTVRLFTQFGNKILPWRSLASTPT